MRADVTVGEGSVSAHCDDVLGNADAVEIARRVGNREVHATEVVEAAIARAERVNPKLNAIAARGFEAALRSAKRPRTGVLAGVPTFIKDTEPVAGLPMLFGSHALPARPAERTSPFVKQFLSLGLVGLGTSTMSEFGLTGTTEARAYGRTHNPWKLGFSSGGSSGGSAALVAAGVVPVAHANDGGGSIRIPASCCGLVGLKPSRGRLVDLEGTHLMPVRLQHQGMLSRSVRDTAVFYHGAERYHRTSRLPAIGLVTHPGRRLRIGFFVGLSDAEPAHRECAVAARDAAQLCASLGHSVEPCVPPFDDRFHEDFLLLWSMMAFAIARFGKWIIHPEFDSAKLDAFTMGLCAHFSQRAWRAPRAIHRLRRFGRRYAECFETYDVLLSPTTALPPPEHGYIGPEVPFETCLERMRWYIPFTPIHNVAGTPAISLPLGRSQSGLPIGVQFAAAMGRERTLLELALELEQAAPWPTTCSKPLSS
jgi:amidase